MVKKNNSDMSVFAETIYKQKYAMELPDGSKETWAQTAKRVAKHVMRAVNAPRSVVNEIEKMLVDRKFMPGGRYLYATGRPYKNVQNCLLLTADDSREGWSELMQKATMALMTGSGIGIVYSSVRAKGKPIRKTGGTATGPLALMQMVNEAGRGIRQGGSRRSAIWAGLHWDHPDCMEFISSKNWSPEVREMKEKDFNFPAHLDGTNISVILNDEFFKAYDDEKHPKHALAHGIYWGTVRQMLKTAEPGFSIDIGPNKGENLRNAPICAGTAVLTDSGYKDVIELVDRPAIVWTGKQWAKNVVFKKTSDLAEVVKVTFSNGNKLRCDPSHPFLVHGEKWIDRVPAGQLMEGDFLVVSPPDGVSEVIKVKSVEPDGKEAVYCADVGVEEHSFQAEGVIISNCTEITSRDDSDICNLGSINMARIESLEEMKKIVELSTMFLLAGTVYSDVPYPKVDIVRTKNRRLGLGLMGLHEWLLRRGKQYGPDAELEEYLKVYATSTEIAHKYASAWELSSPVKTRAIAPTGTISIVAETTSGIEPIFCVAYKRRYVKGDVHHYQYVVDPGAQTLIEQGVNPESIEDAYSLANDVERRVAFQAWVQQYVDHAISSTINLPSWGSELNNENGVQQFGHMLMKYLPKLRGVTVYPDGARGGQPLTAVKYNTAIKHLGQEFSEVGESKVVFEQGDVCDLTKGGTCGS